MAEEIDDLLNRVTHRLRFDPELCLEIQRELRAHFKDKIAESRAAGLSDEESRKDALAAMGDPAELADQLWRANRRRMTSHAIIKWLAVTLLAPAAFVVCLFIALDVCQSAAPVIVSLLGGQYNRSFAMPGPVLDLAASRTERIIGPVPPQQRHLFSPDMAMAASPNTFDSFKKELAQAKAASDAQPLDPALLAQYALQFVSSLELNQSASTGDPLLAKPDLDTALAIIARGERLQPDNAFFPLIAAQCMVRASSRQMRDQPANYHPSSVIYADGSTHAENAWKLKIENASLFTRAMAIVHRAAGMSHFDNQLTSLRDRRLALLPPGNNLGNAVLRINTDFYSERGDLWAWDLMFTISAHALDDASAGDRSKSLQLEADFNRIAALVASNGEKNRMTVFTTGFYPDVVAAHAAAVLELDGQNKEARDLRSWMLDFSQRRRDVFHGGKNADSRSVVANVFAPYLYGVTFDAASLNLAEYALADRTALTALIGILLAIALVAALCALIENLTTSNRAGFAFTIVPRPRESALLLMALMLPIALYASYVTLLPEGNRSAGLNVRYQALMTEYLVLLPAVITLALGAAIHIARRRLVAVGSIAMDHSPLKLMVSLLPTIATLLLVYVLIVYVLMLLTIGAAAKVPPPLQDTDNAVALFLIPCAMTLLSVALLLAIRLRRAQRSSVDAINLRSMGSLFRSIAVMAAMLALIAGLIGGISLHHIETSAVQRIENDPVLSHMDVENDPRVESLRQEVSQRSQNVAAVSDYAASSKN